MPYLIFYFILALIIFYIAFNKLKYLINMDLHSSIFSIVKRLTDSYKTIVKTFNYMDRRTRSKEDIIPASEWLMDNFYLIEREYKELKVNLATTYNLRLPVTTKESGVIVPRIYDLAVAIAEVSGGKIDETIITSRLQEYQENNILTSRELWALPLMLRIALLNNIAEISDTMMKALEEKKLADKIAEEILRISNDGKGALEKLNSSLEGIEFTVHFVERLLKVLRDSGLENQEIYVFINEKLQLQDKTNEKMIVASHQLEAAMQLGLGNCINGIRIIDAINWRKLFQGNSVVEATLSLDPAGIYSKMEFKSKEYYRNKIEKLSRKHKISEAYIAKKAVECAMEAQCTVGENYKSHVGFYIIDDGLPKLMHKIGDKSTSFESVRMFITANKAKIYIFSIVTATVFLTFIFTAMNNLANPYILPWEYLLAFILLTIPSAEIVISLFNWSVTQLKEPEILPKLDFKREIPEEFATAVVIPTFIKNESNISALVRSLEVYYLANDDKNIFFVLLADLRDYTEEFHESDSETIEFALSEIRRLNNKYSSGRENKFYLLCRNRIYNSCEKIWMGWERKRGKLQEFNGFIRGEEKGFQHVSEGISALRKVKFVITLDADTELIRGTAARLIGTIAHPLNRAVLGEKDGKVIVTRGYGVLQPRIAVNLISSNKTLFSKIFSGEKGMDTYTNAVSDVYQDLFGEGSFSGKGIYEADVFTAILNERIVENAILSHDLLEGCFARAGLVSDIQLMDGYPAYYNSNSKRIHRWIRGDWQLLPWLFDFNNSLSLLCRWKILDNLRRSTVPLSVFLLLLFSVLITNNNSGYIFAALMAVACPIIFNLSESVVEPLKGLQFKERYSSFKLVCIRVFLVFSFIPYQCIIAIDAIIRALYRMFFSRKKLLEWETAADVEGKIRRDVTAFIIQMWPGSAISLVLFFLIFSKSVLYGMLAFPFIFIWVFSPVIAWYVSREIVERKIVLSEKERLFVRRISRKTWAYFEDFENSNNGWLAPDNFQEEPYAGTADRISPTNIGMTLIAPICSCDLGYIGVHDALAMLKNSLRSMEAIEKYRGHFYNWYDLNNFKPMIPKFVSTVDSGNLLGYYWTIDESLSSYLESPLLKVSKAEGLKDLILLASQELKERKISNGFYVEFLKSYDFKVNKTSFESWCSLVFNLREELEGIFYKISDSYWNIKLLKELDRDKNEISKFFKWHSFEVSEDEVIKRTISELNELPFSMPLSKLSHCIDKTVQDYESSAEPSEGKDAFIACLKECSLEAKSVITLLQEVKNKIVCLAEEMDFKFLYNEDRELFSIAYDAENNTLLNGFYDLLASEARQASFLAIAKGDVHQDHWFKLGRAATVFENYKGLISWTGTMFEYFMPALIMKHYPDTIFKDTYDAVIHVQRKYCREKGVPWGISEAAFYSFDANKIYQYKAMGIPELGFKRGLGDDLVVAPYATLLALPFKPTEAVQNLMTLCSLKMEGKYGFYDSIDFTKTRLKKGRRESAVKCYMVHHLGMGLMAIDNYINDFILQKRFHSVPRVRATEILLQEKLQSCSLYLRRHENKVNTIKDNVQNIIARKYETVDTDMPEVLLLSNGSLSTMISINGSGYSKGHGVMLYRWKEDVTLDNYGMYFYIKDKTDNKLWSSTVAPCKTPPDSYSVRFAVNKADFERRDGDVITHTELCLSNEDDSEIRSVKLTNLGKKTKIVEITSYLEVTLASYKSYIVHPAFSNLFITTEFSQEGQCLIASRKPRTNEEEQLYLMQTVITEGEAIGDIEYETNRMNFIGRNKDSVLPEAIEKDMPLSNTTGIVLDPVFSMRRKVKLTPGESCKVTYITSIGNSKEEVLKLALKYNTAHIVERAFELATTQSQLELKYLGIKSSQANLYQVMASRILFINPSLRARENYIRELKNGQSALWAYGVSGDLPIVLNIVKKESELDITRQLLKAHDYWTIKGLTVDLVILNEEQGGYFQPVMDRVRELINSGASRDRYNKNGGIFVLNSSSMPEDHINLFKAIARLVIDAENGLIITQIKKNSNSCLAEGNKAKVINAVGKSYTEAPYYFEGKELKFNNGIGGFDVEGHEYVIKLKDYKRTPLPWCNVIAKEDFGFLVSESGSSCTWNLNSRENKLSSWSNDWVTDSGEEYLYLCDESDGAIWSVTPEPIRSSTEYIISHGFGYSNFKCYQRGIICEETIFASHKHTVKICDLVLKNNTDIERKLSVTYYSQLVLGVVPQFTSQYIFTGFNTELGYIYGENKFSDAFRNEIAFLKIVGGSELCYTGNRSEFIGRCGDAKSPQGLYAEKLSNNTGGGYDPCLCQRVNVHLVPGEEKHIIILIGQCRDAASINDICESYDSQNKAAEELVAVKAFWNEELYKVVVKTPDESMNLMLNGWLLYQTLSCRMWGKTAFYQSGGAFGYRDQLQDSLALLYSAPEITRAQIIRCASRQFVEGDVQHWWHPVVESGIRTRFSDDLLWLPYVTAKYVKLTGDYSVLDEVVTFLSGDELSDGEDEKYFIAKEAQDSGTIYEHCKRAIERSLEFGTHNLPHIGSGDWNDGMNTVGNKGKGESVWLGWFLYKLLEDFNSIVKSYKEDELASKYNMKMDVLRQSLNLEGWDGNWYRRAYFDDGTPLGSAENEECQIDSLAQSWAVISGAGDKEKTTVAMESLNKYLTKYEKGMILLLTPAFNKANLEPGYIKGYVPGVRENGGQYTHAAVWVVLATAMLGHNNKAWELFHMINPINHSKTQFECEIYKTEPYVMTADIYSREPHYGRGGWSWYTGAAGWMYTVGIEAILGLKLEGKEGFSVKPCIPDSWEGFSMEYRKGSATYKIDVKKGDRYVVMINGKSLEGDIIPHYHTGEYNVEIILERQ